MLADIHEKESGIPEILGQRATVVPLVSGDYAGSIATGGMWGCERKSLVGDTPVLLKVDGEIRIVSIAEAYGLFHSGHSLQAFGCEFPKIQGEWFDIYNATKHRSDRIIEISFTRTGTDTSILRTSTGHNVYRLKREGIELVPSSALRRGDFLIQFSPPSLDSDNLPDFIAFMTERRRKLERKGWDIKEGWFSPSNSIKNWYKFPVYEEALFFLLGVIVAEGTVSPKTILISSYGAAREIVVRTLENVVGQVRYSSNDSCPTITSADWVSYLKSLGIKPKAGDKEVPSIVFEASEKMKASFIKGYLMGDGYLVRRDPSPSIRAISKSKNLAVGLSYLFTSLGIPNTVRAEYKWYQGEQQEYFVISVDRSSIFLEKVGQIPTKEFTTDRQHRVAPWELTYQDGHNKSRGEKPLPVKVRRIYGLRELIGDFDLYDLSVEKAENFMAGVSPVLVHNTVSQFLQDMSTGILKNQLTQLIDYYDIPFLIKEGSVYPDKFGKCIIDGWLHTNYLFSSLLECIRHWKFRGVVVEETRNQRETANRLIAIEDFFTDEKNASRMVTERVFTLGTRRDTILDIVSRLPLVGSERARVLLEEFGSIQAIVNAEVKDLQKVSGIGKTIASKIYQEVRRKWEDSKG